MTREEAIQVLQTALTAPFIYGEYAEAIDMAIEALRNCSEKPNGSLINRQDAIDAIPQTSADVFENCQNCKLLDRGQVIDIIESLQSAGQNCVLCEYYTEIETDDGIKGKCTRRTGSDLISRQDIKYHTQLEAMGNGRYEEVEIAYKNDIESLPSAEPKTKCIAQIRIDRDDIEDLVNEKVNEIVDKMEEPKTGEWNRLSHDTFHCNLCGHTFIVMQGDDAMNYCPNCGKRMVREDGEEE